MTELWEVYSKMEGEQDHELKRFNKLLKATKPTRGVWEKKEKEL